MAAIERPAVDANHGDADIRGRLLVIGAPLAFGGRGVFVIKAPVH